MKYRIEKIMCVFRWLAHIFVVDVILRALSWLLYKRVVYPLRNQIRWLWNKQGWYRWIAAPLWIFLNDGKSNDIGYDWFWLDQGIYPVSSRNKRMLSWYWSGLRNPAWNSYEFLKPRSGKKTDIEIVCNDSIKGDDIAGIMEFCTLKWLDSYGEPSDNIGVSIDPARSVLGKNFVWYRISGKLYFRYSKAWVDENLKIARELQFGWNDSRAKIRNKLKSTESKSGLQAFFIYLILLPLNKLTKKQ